MNRDQLLWIMTAEQFASFDVQLYLDTHPNDKNAYYLMERYKNNYKTHKQEFESAYGPLTADCAGFGHTWSWVGNPWPWEREAN